MVVIIGFLSIFLFLAILAPVLLKIGLESPAKIIYKIYEALCHQLSFRTYFLFGEQGYYPRRLSGVYSKIYYEDIITGQLDLDFARKFLGNERIGYKLALCQRDIAIYGSLLITGIIFQVTKRKIRPIPWYIWIFVGLLPIGIDGVSQFGGLGVNLFSFLPFRESSPFVRTITGSLFGISTGFFMFPMIEETMLISNRAKT